MRIVERLCMKSPPTEADFVLLHDLIGSRLPDDYREFLISENGGKPQPSKIVFDTIDGTSDTSIRYFLSLSRLESQYSVWKYLNLYRDRIPSKSCPIACDSFGNLILIDLKEESNGNVLFWDHEKENDESEIPENLSLIARSFTELIDLLVV